MAITCPVDLDTARLRVEIRSIYSRVASAPDGEFHFHRGAAYAETFLRYEPQALARRTILIDHQHTVHHFSLSSLEVGPGGTSLKQRNDDARPAASQVRGIVTQRGSARRHPGRMPDQSGTTRLTPARSA